MNDKIWTSYNHICRSQFNKNITNLYILNVLSNPERNLKKILLEKEPTIENFSDQSGKEIKPHRHEERLITQLVDFRYELRAFKEPV